MLTWLICCHYFVALILFDFVHVIRYYDETVNWGTARQRCMEQTNPEPTNLATIADIWEQCKELSYYTGSIQVVYWYEMYINQ